MEPNMTMELLAAALADVDVAYNRARAVLAEHFPVGTRVVYERGHGTDLEGTVVQLPTEGPPRLMIRNNTTSNTYWVKAMRLRGLL
jgi:hypothetical protein